jgi:hypothetical protein
MTTINSVTSKLHASRRFHFMLKLSSASFAIAFMTFASVGLMAQDPIADFRDEIARPPGATTGLIIKTLRGAGPQAARLAGPITAAAIENLGPSPAARRVSSIVFAAVRAVPGSVLEIVRAAVIAAPKAAPEIAAAAAAAVPNPWKEVRYQRQAPPVAGARPPIAAGPGDFFD